MRLIDLCCGAGAVSLCALGGPRALPPVGWLGGKRRQAGAILDALGVGDRVSEVVMVDSSSWGWVWSTVLGAHGDAVADMLDAWAGEDARALWDRLVVEPLPGEPVEDAARWLAVQAHCARGREAVPGAPWRTPGFLYASISAGLGRDAARIGLSTVAARVRSARGALAGRAKVFHMDARRVTAGPGDVVVFDPPYDGTTGYRHDLPRADVLALACELRAAGARVAVCEAVPLPLDGWHHVDLTHLGRRTSGPEWLTLSHAPRGQAGLFA